MKLLVLFPASSSVYYFHVCVHNLSWSCSPRAHETKPLLLLGVCAEHNDVYLATTEDIQFLETKPQTVLSDGIFPRWSRERRDTHYQTANAYSLIQDTRAHTVLHGKYCLWILVMFKPTSSVCCAEGEVGYYDRTDQRVGTASHWCHKWLQCCMRS